jgi:DNA-binding transcriptional LysR family regulator
MTKAGVPQLRGDDGDMAARRRAMWNGVEIPVAIAPMEDRLGLEILNRKTRGVKLN